MLLLLLDPEGALRDPWSKRYEKLVQPEIALSVCAATNLDDNDDDDDEEIHTHTCIPPFLFLCVCACERVIAHARAHLHTTACTTSCVPIVDCVFLLARC